MSAVADVSGFALLTDTWAFSFPAPLCTLDPFLFSCHLSISESVFEHMDMYCIHFLNQKFNKLFLKCHFLLFSTKRFKVRSSYVILEIF